LIRRERERKERGREREREREITSIRNNRIIGAVDKDPTNIKRIIRTGTGGSDL
jgi:hypothetical protein